VDRVSAVTRTAAGRRKRFVSCLGLVFAGLPLFAAEAAEQSWGGHMVTTVVRFEALPVGAAEGHSVGLYENRGAIVHDDGRIGHLVARGTFDFVRGVASYQGYVVIDYEDGSRAHGETRGSYDATGAQAIDRGTMTFTGGDAGLEDLRGEGSYEGRALAPIDDGGTFYYTWTATVTLPD
jgi:hypothetical protein